MLAARNRRTRLGTRRLAGVVAAVLLAAASLGAVAALASTRSVGVADGHFTVKRLTVARGARVKWTWTGVLKHNVTVKSGPARFHSRSQVLGTFSHVFTTRGTYLLYCTFHPGMKMTVVVR